MQAELKQEDRAGGATRERVRAAGLRITAARVRVLAVLEQAGLLMSHHDVEKALGTEGSMDRVTLYRVLDTLVASGLAHRVAGADRIWRFGVTAGEAGLVVPKHGKHAHFQCRDCGRIVCLDGVPAAGAALRLPRGFQSDEVELTVRGRCAKCAAAQTVTQAAMEG